MPTKCFVSDSQLRIHASTERIRSLRARLHVVAPRVEALERDIESARTELAVSRAQASQDRETVVRLEAALAEREELRSTLRERLAEVGRMLGQ